MNQRFALSISERSRPSINDWLPPVTRLMIVSIAAGPVKVALSPVLMLKRPKLMKEIGAHRLAHGIGDHKIGAGERTRWA
jgi:hypothetical protein